MSSDTADAVVRFDAVSKQFPLEGRRSLVREASPFLRPTPSRVAALAEVSFAVRPGEALGVIGRNGAGKSTLLKLAAGIMEPTHGAIDVVGPPGSMIELGLAFQPELTGWENLPSAAALLGLDRRQLAEVEDDVADFSGIRELLGLPVKHFSTGMVARLGFSLATHLSAQVLLIDEVLAVGDRRFQNACIDRVRTLVRSGVALLFVSHDLDMVCHMCERVICLEGGRVVDDGPATEVVARYARDMLAPRGPRWRSAARIESVVVDEPTIPTGGTFDVTCVVDVVQPVGPLRPSSQIYPPSSGVGTVNADELEPGSLDRPGRWELRAGIGPIPSSAATLELEVALVEGAGDPLRRDALVDRITVPIEIAGEEMGSPLWVMDGNWRLRGSDPVQEVPVRSTRARLEDAAIRTESVSKRFSSRRLNVQELLAGQATRLEDRDLAAVDDVTFEMARGESVGLIGSNGAGKSTLLRLLAGVSEPSSGAISVSDGVVAVLELGIGFHEEMTGEENLQFSWALEGGSPEAYLAARHAMAEFADIGDVLKVPVKHYSTGMRARLALALALELDPQVLLIDEALSTGDIEFRQRMLVRLSAMCSAGMTLLFASHDLHLVTRLCDRVLRLESGRLVEDGPASVVIANAGGAGWAGGTTTAEGGVVVRDLRVLPDVLDWGEPLTVEFEIEVGRPSPKVYLEFSMRQTLDEYERAEPKSPADVLQLSLCVQRLDAIAEITATPGVHRVVGVIEDIPANNSTDVVISAIDAIDGAVISEQWHTVFLGRATEDDLAGRLHVDWSATFRGPVPDRRDGVDGAAPNGPLDPGD